MSESWGPDQTGQLQSGASGDEWAFRLRGGVAVAPDYRGSDDYEFKPVPLVDARYGDWFFIGFPAASGST
ncbi:MipA/OmpV family protein [Endozoicomonas sp. G2_2]|nr:MipA/OmpV family protein [Endozoicomonas sp. G2_2]MBO9471390.1 MipA/OmpV family protein [Endozoicomonas sp. G2_2]